MMKTFKREGRSYKISNDVTDDQITLEVGEKTDVTKVDTNSQDYKDFNTLYGNGMTQDDKDVKDEFNKSKNYIPTDDTKSSGELDDKSKIEESNKIVEDDGNLDEAFYEKICRACVDTFNLEWVTTNPENNNSIVHGYFPDDETASTWGFGAKVEPNNFKDVVYDENASDTSNDNDWYEYDTWEDFYEGYIKDEIAYDINDIGLYGPNGYDFYISKEDLEKLGFDLSEFLEESKSNISYKDWLGSKAFWVEVYDNFGCDSWTDVNNRLSKNDLNSLYKQFLDSEKSYDVAYANITEKLSKKHHKKQIKTEELKSKEKELADKYGITEHINKLTNDLMAIEGVTDVDYDLDGYNDGMNGPITLVDYALDAKLSASEYFQDVKELLNKIYQVFEDNGVVIEKEETEDNDSYFYFVSYNTNWDKSKKTESPMPVLTKQQIYDELCAVLTDYETGPHPSASKLYDMLVKIQNNWEQVITAEE